MTHPSPDPVAAPADRAMVLGCQVDRLDMAATVARCEAIVEAGGFAQQVSINAAKVVAMRSDPQLRSAIEGCELINADGQSVVWASRLLGDPLPERVAGIDLMHELLSLAERRGWGVYILGARREVLDTALERLHDAHPRLVVSGARDGYFEESESEGVVAAIRASGARLLFVAISSPRKENWLSRNREALGVSFAMGVGGSIDVVAGVTRRAPRSWQRLGLEWLYRLLQEPRRMLRRYLVSNLRFCGLLAAALLARASGRLTRRASTPQ